MFDYTPSPTLLADRTILVTGAGDGIGRAAAKSFAAKGATVILLGRTINKLEVVYDEIEQAGYHKPAIYPIDFQKAPPLDYKNLADAIGTEFGQLDGLLHNAATLGTLTPIEHYDINQWYQVLQTNLNAPFLLTRALLPLMKNARDASIVFTTDDVGRKGKAYWGAYAVSKFATEGMMQILADELETNTTIRVNGINPGIVRTSMRTAIYPAIDPKTLPLPETIMPLYLYLIGSDSHLINGQTLNAQEE